MKSWILPLILLTTSLHAQAGLFDQPQTFPWSVGLTPVGQDTPGGLDPEGLRVKSSILWFNTYRQAGLGDAMEQLIDLEGLLGTVSVAWSPLRQWEVRAQAQGWVLGGGVMDLFLSGFHGAIAVPNQGRDQRPENGYRDYLKGTFDLTSPSSGLTQWSLGARWFEGPWSVWASVKPPLAAPLDWGWSDRWSTAVGVGGGVPPLTQVLGVLWGGGVFVAAVAAESDPPFSEGGWGVAPQAGGHLSARFPWKWTGLVQGSWTAVPSRGRYYLSQGAGLLTAGFQIPLDESWTAEAALTEEFLTWATMEVGFHIGLTWNQS